MDRINILTLKVLPYMYIAFSVATPLCVVYEFKIDALDDYDPDTIVSRRLTALAAGWALTSIVMMTYIIDEILDDEEGEHVYLNLIVLMCILNIVCSMSIVFGLYKRSDFLMRFVIGYPSLLSACVKYITVGVLVILLAIALRCLGYAMTFFTNIFTHVISTLFSIIRHEITPVDDRSYRLRLPRKTRQQKQFDRKATYLQHSGVGIPDKYKCGIRLDILRDPIKATNPEDANEAVYVDMRALREWWKNPAVLGKNPITNEQGMMRPHQTLRSLNRRPENVSKKAQVMRWVNQKYNEHHG